MGHVLSDISFKIKKLRQDLGYTQQQIAGLLNIERSTYAYYESGRTVPDLDVLSKLSKIFNLPLAEFLESEKIGLMFSDAAFGFVRVGSAGEANLAFREKKSPLPHENLEKNHKKASLIEGQKRNIQNGGKNAQNIQSSENNFYSNYFSLTNSEKELLMGFRMLPREAQLQLSEIINEKISLLRAKKAGSKQ